MAQCGFRAYPAARRHFPMAQRGFGAYPADSPVAAEGAIIWMVWVTPSCSRLVMPNDTKMTKSLLHFGSIPNPRIANKPALAVQLPSSIRAACPSQTIYSVILRLP